MTKSIKLSLFDQLGNFQSDGCNNQKKNRLNYYVSYRMVIAINVCESTHFLGFWFYWQIISWMFFRFLATIWQLFLTRNARFCKIFQDQGKNPKNLVLPGKKSKIIQDRNVIAITAMINIRSRLWKELTCISSSRRFDILENTVQTIQQWVLFCQMTNLVNHCLTSNQ